jgi:hypothetical protein
MRPSGWTVALCVLGGVVVGSYVTQKLAAEAWHWSGLGVYVMFIGISAAVAAVAYVIASSSLRRPDGS